MLSYMVNMRWKLHVGWGQLPTSPERLTFSSQVFVQFQLCWLVVPTATMDASIEEVMARRGVQPQVQVSRSVFGIQTSGALVLGCIEFQLGAVLG